MSDNAKIRLQVSKQSNFGNIISDKTVTYTGGIVNLIDGDFSGGGPKQETLYMRAKHISDHGESTWGSVVSFVIKGSWEDNPEVIAPPIQVNTINSDDLRLIRISSTSVFICYINIASSSHVYANMLSINGTTITVSSAVKCNSVSSSFLNANKISNNKVAISYLNANKNSEMLIATISGTSITAAATKTIGNISSLGLATNVLSITDTTVKLVMGTSQFQASSSGTDTGSLNFTSSGTYSVYRSASAVSLTGRGARGTTVTTLEIYQVSGPSGSTGLPGSEFYMNPPHGFGYPSSQMWRVDGKNYRCYHKWLGPGIGNSWEATTDDGQTIVLRDRIYNQTHTQGASATASVSGGSTYTFSGSNGSGAASTSSYNVPSPAGKTINISIPNCPQNESYIRVYEYIPYSYPEYNRIYFQVITITLSTNNITAASAMICNSSANAITMSMSDLNNGRAVIGYINRKASNKVLVQLVNDGGTYSSPFTVTDRSCTSVLVVPLDSSSVMTIYGSGNKIYARIIGQSGNTLSGLNNETLVVNVNSVDPAVASLSRSNHILVFSNTAQNSIPYYVSVDINSNNVISKTDPIKCSSVTNTRQPIPILLDEETLLLAHKNSSNGRVSSQVIKN